MVGEFYDPLKLLEERSTCGLRQISSYHAKRQTFVLSLLYLPTYLLIFLLTSSFPFYEGVRRLLAALHSARSTATVSGTSSLVSPILRTVSRTS